MKVKNILFIFSAVVLVGMMLMPVLAIRDHVRWNPLLDECVYYYNQEPGTAHCFVHPSHCEGRRGNLFKTVNPVECSDLGFSQPIPSCEEFIEGDVILLNYEASDPDADIGPAGELIYTFGEPFNADNEWRTERGDAGTYTVEVTVSDGEYEDTTSVCFKVLPGNKLPVLTVGDVTGDEGETLKLDAECTDEDGDDTTITFSGDMDSPTWRPGYDDAGTYKVTVRCTDGYDTVSEETTVTVVNANRVPVLVVNDVTVTEGQIVMLTPSCRDPDGSDTNIAFSGAMYSDTWKTGFTDAGNHEVTVSCIDASGSETHDTVVVTVLDKNRPPMIDAVVRRG